MQKSLLIIIIILICRTDLFSQPAPASDENIPYLVTFGANSRTSWGDDDFCQVFFFIIPASYTDPIYIRVYDPDTGGNIDEAKSEYNTTTRFSVYGGNTCWSDKDAQAIDPVGNYKSGILLSTKTFGSEQKYDEKYYTFGPFNPFEGEHVKKFDGRVFKIIAIGESGDDGNLYRYFLSTDPDKNIAIQGGNVFTYEYTFRLPNEQSEVSQIYPYVDDKTISIEVSNFDWDNDGTIRIISVAKNNVLSTISADNLWVMKKFPIHEEEKNTTLEIQFIKNKTTKIINNNVVVVVRNQYGVSLPFFVIPIGGIPVYTPKIKMKGIQ
jgi:hypothetical protein